MINLVDGAVLCQQKSIHAIGTIISFSELKYCKNSLGIRLLRLIYSHKKYVYGETDILILAFHVWRIAYSYTFFYKNDFFLI